MPTTSAAKARTRQPLRTAFGADQTANASRRAALRRCGRWGWVVATAVPAMPAAVRARATMMAAAVAAHAALEQSFKESHVLLRRPAQVCLAGS